MSQFLSLTVHQWLIVGKSAETFGSILVAFVGVKAMYLEVSIGRHLVPQNFRSTQTKTGGTDLDRIGRRLEDIHTLRKRQFGGS